MNSWSDLKKEFDVIEGGLTETPAAAPVVTDDRVAPVYAEAKSYISAGSTLHGELVFDSSVRVDGTLSGDVACTKALIVGPNGVLDGKVKASVLIVLGKVKGDITVTEKIEIYSGGRIEGSIHTPELDAENGSHVSGRVSFAKPAEKEKGHYSNGVIALHA